MELLDMSLRHCKTNKQPPTLYKELIMLRDSFGASCLLHPTEVPSTPLQGWSWTWRNWASPEPSTKSKSCSHGHTIAAINQDGGNYNDLEQTTPKAICEQELSAKSRGSKMSLFTHSPQTMGSPQSRFARRHK